MTRTDSAAIQPRLAGASRGGFGRALLLLPLIAFGIRAAADTITLAPAADTSLVEAAPDNNLGGEWFVPAGVTQNRTRAHGLFRFDLHSIRPGAQILSASLILQVTGQPSAGYTPAAFDLQRILEPWGEGSEVAQYPNHPGMGAPATANEATWTHRFAFTTNIWATPGAAPPRDCSATISAQQFIYDVGNSPYTFGSSAQMAADVQAWVDRPEANFGWLLRADDETANFTARRFASREDTNNAPQLVIEFAPPLRLSSPRILGDQFAFDFNMETGRVYTVEASAALGPASWVALTNLAAPNAPRAVTIFDSRSGRARFYRVAAAPAPALRIRNAK